MWPSSKLHLKPVNIYLIFSYWLSETSNITALLGIYQLALLGLYWHAILTSFNFFLYFFCFLVINLHDYVLFTCDLFVFMLCIFITLCVILFVSIIIIVIVVVTIFAIYVILIFCIVHILIWFSVSVWQLLGTPYISVCRILDIIFIVNQSNSFPLKIGHPLVIAGWSSYSDNSSIWPMV